MSRTWGLGLGHWWEKIHTVKTFLSVPSIRQPFLHLHFRILNLFLSICSTWNASGTRVWNMEIRELQLLRPRRNKWKSYGNPSPKSTIAWTDYCIDPNCCGFRRYFRKLYRHTTPSNKQASKSCVRMSSHWQHTCGILAKSKVMSLGRQ